MKILLTLPWLYLGLLLSIGANMSFSQDTTGLAIDSTILIQPDSIATSAYDSVKVAKYDSSSFESHDSTKTYVVPFSAGSLFSSPDSNSTISRAEMNWMHYRSLTGILEQYPGVFMRNQYSEGQYDGITIRGNDWRSVAFMMDGRLLNDPASGIYNPNYFSTAYADRIEIITGPRSFLYGLNSSGGAINIVTPNLSLTRPFSVLNYAESGYNYSYADGVFSQNIGRKFNMMLGFQQQSTDGRFENSESEQWNARIKLRYSILENLHVTLSEYFTHTQTGLNGGIDPTSLSTAFDPRLATVVNTNSYEKVTRHDVNASLIGSFFDDSTSLSTLTFYYSHNLREYRDEENRQEPNGIFIQEDHTSSWMGTTLKQALAWGNHLFTISSTLDRKQIVGNPDFWLWNVWALQDFYTNSKKTRIGLFSRFDGLEEQSLFGLGIDFNIQANKTVEILGGFSLSQGRYDDLAKAEFGFRIRGDNFGFIKGAMFFSSTERSHRNGFDGSMSLFFGWLQIEANGMLFTFLENKEYPRLSGSFGIYYRNILINGNLELKSGFKGRYLSSYNGATFDPEHLVYTSTDQAPIGKGGSVDFETTAHIGDAYVTFTWENLASTQYFVTPYYPVLDREIRFGISWQFLD